MDSAYFWTTIGWLGFGTLLIRSSFFFLYRYIKIPKPVQEGLVFIPTAVLPALLVPVAFFHQGEVLALFGKERFLSLVVAAIVCYRSKSVILTIVSGLLALYLLRLLGA